MDPRLFFPLITGRDVAREAAWRQRPPVVDREQIDRLLVDSFLRIAGDSGGPADDDASLRAETDGPVAGDSPDTWRWLFDVGRPGTRFRPDSGSIIDDGVLRVPPGTNPLGDEQSLPHLQYTPDVQSPARPRSSLSVFEPAIGRLGDRPTGPVIDAGIARVGSSAGGPRFEAGIARVGSSAGDGSVRAEYRSPAPGLLAASGPSGAGSSPTRAAPARDRVGASGPSGATSSSATPPAAVAPAAGGALASTGQTVRVLPTGTAVENLAAATTQQAAALAEKAAETSVDRLRREIFANQTARNSLFSH